MAGEKNSKYKPEYDVQAHKLCLLGADDKQLADFFNVTETTINNWKNAHSTFIESIKQGKQEYDIKRVENSLLNRALGYTVTESSDEEGSNAHGPFKKTTKKERHIPADTASMVFYLRNRRGKDWSNNPIIDDEGNRENKAFTFNISVKDPLNVESD